MKLGVVHTLVKVVKMNGYVVNDGFQVTTTLQNTCGERYDSG